MMGVWCQPDNRPLFAALVHLAGELDFFAVDQRLQPFLEVAVPRVAIPAHGFLSVRTKCDQSNAGARTRRIMATSAQPTHLCRLLLQPELTSAPGPAAGWAPGSQENGPAWGPFSSVST